MFGQGLDIQALGPVGSTVRGASPRMTALLHAHQGVHGRFGHFGLLHDEMAAHVHDGVNMLHPNGTLLHAGSTGQTFP